MTGVPADDIEARVLVTGRVSGAKRPVRLWFVVLGQRVFVLAERPERSQWLRNVQANPDVQLEIGGRTWPARATPANGGPDDRAVRAAFGAKYGTKHLARFLAESFVVAIDTLGEPSVQPPTPVRRRRSRTPPGP